MKIFTSSEIKNNPINRITTAQEDNKLDVVMVGNEKSAKLGTFSKVFNYYLKQTTNDKLPQLLAWFFLKKQMVEEGFNADKFETLIFNNFIDKDKYTWNQMSEDERKDWMSKNDISGIDINYKFLKFKLKQFSIFELILMCFCIIIVYPESILSI